MKRGIKPITLFLFEEMKLYGYLNQDSPTFFENNDIDKNKKNENSSINPMKNIKEDLKENNNRPNSEEKVNHIITPKKKKRKEKEKLKKQKIKKSYK